MRILAACSLGGAGHLNPLLPFLFAARARGDEVLVVGPGALSSMVAAAGFAFRAGGEPAEAEVAPIRERLATVPAAEASVLGNRELFGRLAADALRPEMRRAVREWSPHLVLREPCEYASAAVAEECGVPAAQVAISLADVEAGSIRAATPALEAARPGLTADLHRAPYLTRFPTSLDPSPFPSTFRYRERLPGPSRPLPDWWTGSQAPLIYVTFGSVLGAVSIAADVYRTAVAAVAGMPARVLLTVGRAFDPAQLGALPANVHVQAWVDQTDVLAVADLVVCHGGSGTVLGALAAGRPLVVLPSFADQFVNGRRIANAGAGLVVEATGNGNGVRRPPGAAEIPRLAAAVRAVLAGDGYRQAAERVAREIATAPTAADVLAQLTG